MKWKINSVLTSAGRFYRAYGHLVWWVIHSPCHFITFWGDVFRDAEKLELEFLLRLIFASSEIACHIIYGCFFTSFGVAVLVGYNASFEYATRACLLFSLFALSFRRQLFLHFRKNQFVYLTFEFWITSKRSLLSWKCVSRSWMIFTSDWDSLCP